eukprot:8271483-Pyramimonas_sp.AAC.1
MFHAVLFVKRHGHVVPKGYDCVSYWQTSQAYLSHHHIMAHECPSCLEVLLGNLRAHGSHAPRLRRRDIMPRPSHCPYAVPSRPPRFFNAGSPGAFGPPPPSPSGPPPPPGPPGGRLAASVSPSHRIAEPQVFQYELLYLSLIHISEPTRPEPI